MRAFLVRALPASAPVALALILASAAATLAQTDPVVTGEPPARQEGPASPPAVAPEMPATGPQARPAARPQAPAGTPLTDETATTKAERLDALFAELKKAATHETAAATAAKIEQEWSATGSATVDLMLVWAGEAMAKDNAAAALDLVEQAISMKPDDAEVWNRRATLNYIASDFGKSIVDIEKTLSLEPRHYGALMGLGMILEETDRKSEAMETYMRVLEVYPANKGAQDAVARLADELSGQAI